MKTARDVWREQVLGGRLCTHCQMSRAIGTLNMFWPMEDIEADQPALVVKLALQHQGKIPWVEFNVCGEPKKYVPLPVAFFCMYCQKEMEKWAAHAPSKVVCEVRMGPEESKVVGQVPGAERME
jgi:hypothetical protein